MNPTREQFEMMQERLSRGRKFDHSANAPASTAVSILNHIPDAGKKVAKRVRQGEPPLRPWESEWKNHLQNCTIWNHVKAQSIRLRLANGAWYKADVSAVENGDNRQLHLFEVKGGKKMKGYAKGILALKVAASQYPEIIFHLCYKEDGCWKTETLTP